MGKLMEKSLISEGQVFTKELELQWTQLLAHELFNKEDWEKQKSIVLEKATNTFIYYDDQAEKYEAFRPLVNVKNTNLAQIPVEAAKEVVKMLRSHLQNEMSKSGVWNTVSEKIGQRIDQVGAENITYDELDEAVKFVFATEYPLYERAAEILDKELKLVLATEYPLYERAAEIVSEDSENSGARDLKNLLMIGKRRRATLLLKLGSY